MRKDFSNSESVKPKRSRKETELGFLRSGNEKSNIRVKERSIGIWGLGEVWNWRLRLARERNGWMAVILAAGF